MEIADKTDVAGGTQCLNAARSSKDLSATPLGYRVSAARAASSSAFAIEHLVYGDLTSAMMVDDSDVADLVALQEPYLSGGLAFLLGRDLAVPPISLEDAIEAVDLVFPAIAIGQRSREAQAVHAGIADAGDPGGYVIIGDGGREPSEIDLACCGAVLEVDGAFAGSGAGAAMLGHPAKALIWLARARADVGDALEQGAIVIVSDITPAISAKARHHARLAIGGLGSASVRFR